MAALQLEEIFSRLLEPDNEIIKQATTELQTLFKDVNIISPLSEVMVNSQNPQIRQYATIVMRKKLVKVWTIIIPEQRERMKDLLLQCLSKEKMFLVLRSIAHLVSVIAKYEFSESQWVGLSQFIMITCNSQECFQREIGMTVLSSLMETAAVELQPQYAVLLEMLANGLDDQDSKQVPYLAVRALTAMVEYIGTKELPVFQNIVPKAMLIVKALIPVDEDKACEAMELFDELAESDVSIVVPHLNTLIHFCLEVSATVTLGKSIRIKALFFISWLVTLKKKTLFRQGFFPIVIKTMLGIMAEEGKTDEEDIAGDSPQESGSPISVAAQVLDVLSLNLPPEQVYVPMMKHVEPMLQSARKEDKSAGLVAIGVISEGCAEYIKSNYIAELLQVVYNGVEDSDTLVRNSALFAIGQFSEHLQPDISKFHSQLFPVLLKLVDSAIAAYEPEAIEKSGVTKIFYALESYCEQLGEKLTPYLPALLEKLLTGISNTPSLRLQELILSAFGAIANAAQSKLAPYFDNLVQTAFRFTRIPYRQEHITLLSQAADTLGMLAKSISPESFKPLVKDCLSIGMSLMYSDNPDLRKSVFGMLASMATIAPEEIKLHLNVIMHRMMEVLTSDEGVKVHYSASQASFLDFDDDDDQGAQDEGVGCIEDDDGIGFTLDSSYLEEKEDLCNAMAEIAESVGPNFLPFLDDCFREVNILTGHQSDGIRKAAIWTLSKFIRVWYEFSAVDERDSINFMLHMALCSFASTIKTDGDKTVVLSTLECLEELFKSLKAVSYIMRADSLDTLVVAIEDTLAKKTHCQEEEEDSSGLVGDESVAEYDNFLLEAAGSTLGPLGALVGGAIFVTKLESIIPLLTKKLRPTSTVAYKSFAIGTLAEILYGLGSYAVVLVSLYPHFINFSKPEEDDEVCSNAVYGLGVLAANALPDMQEHYSNIIYHLIAVSQAKSENGRVMDNICAAICRMMVACPQALPLQQVFPMVLENLPLKEDFEEFETIYTCFIFFFRNDLELFMSQLPHILRILAHDLSVDSKLPSKLHSQVIQLLHDLNGHHPERVQLIASNSLTPQQLDTLNKVILYTTTAQDVHNKQ